jgi:soluble lytic murein transglycosylase-like protein
MTIAFGLALACVLQAAQARAPVKPVPKPPIAQSAWQQEQAMAPSQLILRWKPLVARASRRAGVPVAWINAVMRVESGGRTMLTDTQPMVSSKGALGLMQVLPQTYQDMRAQYRLGPDPFDPKDNISAGAGYLRWLRGKYGYPAMFAAYNAGPGQIDNVLGGTARLPAETQSYVARVGQILGQSGSGDGSLINAAKFTRPDGSPVLVDPLAVSAVRTVQPGEYPDGVQAVVAMGRLTQAVREDAAAVTAAIRLRGGRV